MENQRDRILLQWIQRDVLELVDPCSLPPAPAVRVTVAGLADGQWQVEAWDTRTGSVIARSTVESVDGRAVIPLEPVAKDVALKLTR